jgi:hypothetical protein
MNPKKEKNMSNQLWEVQFATKNNSLQTVVVTTGPNAGLSTATDVAKSLYPGVRITKVLKR